MSSETVKDYWRDCISDAAEECGAVLTLDQINAIAEAAQGAHDTYGMFVYEPPVGEIERLESARLRRELEIERSKVTCPNCKGHGSIFGYGPYHSSVSRCDKCNGEGRCLR